MSIFCALMVHQKEIKGWQAWVIIYDPRGTHEIAYAWGIGEETNNQAEILALYQGNYYSAREWE